MKCVPCTLIRTLGHLNLVIMSSNIKRPVVATLQSLTYLSSAHLVGYSVTVIIYLAPVRFPGGFIGPTKSMAHFSNYCRVICGANGISFLQDGFPTRWHTLHALVYSLASMCNVGHQRLARRTFCIVVFPA
jgi:hypothetical protein